MDPAPIDDDYLVPIAWTATVPRAIQAEEIEESEPERVLEFVTAGASQPS